MNGRYILVGHTPVEVDELFNWASQFEGSDRRVAGTDIGPYFVSTVFLGLDHPWGQGPPLLFETMVCNNNEDENVRWLDDDGFSNRYSTWEEAERGHSEICKKVCELAGITLDANGRPLRRALRGK